VKLTLEPTSKRVALDGVETRVWEGHDEQGVPVHAYIVRVAIPYGAVTEAAAARFAERLTETRVPSPAVEELPSSMILGPK
jgi:sulfite reductase beta subunit-like hemoprotein